MAEVFGCWKRIIEDAYQVSKSEVEIDGGFIINFTRKVECKKNAVNTQFPVKRVELTYVSTMPAEQRSGNAEVSRVQESYGLLNVCDKTYSS